MQGQYLECLTGDVFGSARVDCGQQLDAAMKRIQAERAGEFLTATHASGRPGIRLINKLKAVRAPGWGRDTVQANIELSFAADLKSTG